MQVERILRNLLTVFVYGGLVYGQTPDAASVFDVASVKPSPAPGPNRSMSRLVHGGPGSTDPGAITLQNMDLFSLIAMAFDIQSYQLAAPSWAATAKFDITAILPPGATRAQYRLMLQDLLANRFKLVLHHEKKEAQVFELVVAKKGTQLREAVNDSVPGDEGTLQPPPTAPTPPPGYRGPMSVVCTRCSMELLASRFSALIGQAVTDGTGLKGIFNIRLQYSLSAPQTTATPEQGLTASNAEANIFDALQEQLGLRLVSKKGLVDIVMVDHLEKVPTEN